MADAGEASEFGEAPRTLMTCSGGTDVASESTVNSDGALTFFFFVGVDDRILDRDVEGLAVFVRTGSLGDLARMVLGCEPVVEVRSVPSYISPCLMLDRDAALGPACEVMRVPLSTLWRPAAMSLCTSSTFLRRMLFALAVFRRSVPAVAVRGGLGGARGGVGATRLGACGVTSGCWAALSSSTSVGSGVVADFLRAASSRE